jgi:CheY-like chemotaxis protein
MNIKSLASGQKEPITEILFVNSNNQLAQDFGRQLGIIFRKNGFKVIIVKNGFEALSLMETNTYKMIFLAEEVELLSFVEIAGMLRSIDKIKETPIIIFQKEHDNEEVIQQCLKAGVTDFVSFAWPPAKTLGVLGKYVKLL